MPTSTGMPSSIDWVAGGTASVSTPTASQCSTDDELHSIIRGAASTMLGTIGESRDPTEESVPAMSKGSSSGSSSFSMTRAFGAMQRRYGSPTHRKESPSHPPRTGKHSLQHTRAERSRSPVKSVHIRKPAYNQNMVVPSISVGRVELQNSPVTSISPTQSNTPSAKSRDRYRRALANQGKSVNMVAAIDDLSVQDQLDMEKGMDQERATRLLSKVYEQKRASQKVQQSREAAKAAIERARRARAEKEKKVCEIFVPNNLSSFGKPSAFNDNIFELLERKAAPPVAPEIFVPSNPSSPGNSSTFSDNLFGLLGDESFNLEGDKYAFADDVDANKNSKGDPVDDVMDMAMAMLAPPKNLDEHYAHADWAKEAPVSEAQVNADDCVFVTGMCDVFREELFLLSGEGDKVDATGQARRPEATAEIGKAAVPSLDSFEINSPAQNCSKAESLNTSEAEFAGDEHESDLANARTWESSELSYSEVKKDPPASGQDPPGFRQDPPSYSETVDEMSDSFSVGLPNEFDGADESDWDDESDDISKREGKNPTGPAHLANPFDDQDDDWTCKSDELRDKPKQETEKATRLERTLPPFDIQDEYSTNKTENELEDIMKFTAGSLGREPKEKATRLERTLPPFDVQDEDSTNNTENELGDIMKFTAGSLGREPKEKATRLKKAIPPLEVQDDDSTNKTENELDDIMNFAAGLLGRKPARKRKTPAPPPHVPKRNEAKVETYAGSDVNGYQSAQAVHQRESASVRKPKNDGSCYQGSSDAWSAWSDDFSSPPEEKLVFVPTDNPVNVAKVIDIPQGTKLGDKPPSLLAASMQASVDDNAIANPLLMLYMQTTETDAELPQKKSNKNLVLSPFEACSSNAKATLPRFGGFSSPKDRRSVPPPPEAFTFSPRSRPILSPTSSKVFDSNTIPTSPRSTASLADDLTEMSSSSVNFPDLFAQSEVIKQKGTDEKLTEAVASCPMMSALVEERPTPTPMPSSKVRNPGEQRVVRESTLFVPTQPQSNVQHSEQYDFPGQPSFIVQRSNQEDVAHLFLESTHDESAPVEAKEQRATSFESSSRSGHKSPNVNEKLNKTTMTVLDSDDEFWDTLSIIASTKDLSMNRVSHPHPHHDSDAKNEAFAKSTKGCALGALLCNFWPTTNLTAKEVEDDDHTSDSSEESLAPEIPRYVAFAKIEREIAQKQKCEAIAIHTTDAARALDNVETLITKESDSSSQSSTSFDMSSKINSFHAEDQAHNLDDAIVPGQKMATTLGASRDDTSGAVMMKMIGASTVDTADMVSTRYGSDQGDEPLGSPSLLTGGSPSLLTDDSRASRANSKSRPRKVVDRKHPWNRRGPVVIPKVKSTTQLKEQDSEFAAMVGIAQASAPSTDEGDVALDSLMTRKYSDESDLFMVLTRSNAEDDSNAYSLAQHQVTDEVISSQLSGDVEFIVLTWSSGDEKFAAAQLDSRVRPRAKELISSPISSEGEDMALTRSDDGEKFDTAQPDCQPHTRVEQVVSSSPSTDIEKKPSPGEVELVVASPNDRNVMASLDDEVPDRHLLGIIGYLSATESHDDESEIIQDDVVLAPPDGPTEIQSANIKDTQMPADEEMMKVGEKSDIPPFVNDLLSKYDTIIQLLLNEKKTSVGESEESKDAEIALTALREQRERAFGTSVPKTPSPLRLMQLSQPQERAAQTQSPIRRHEQDSASPPISPMHTQSPGNDSPTSARVQTNKKLREYGSLPRSPMSGEFTSHSLERDSPKRSPNRTPLRSNRREFTFPTYVSVGWEQAQQSRGSASPTRSPIRSTLASRSYDSDSFTRPSLHEDELQSRLSWSPARLSTRQELTSRREQLDKRRTNLSPIRSPSDRASCLQSRQEASPTRSAGGQERASPSRSPLRQRSNRRARPRPEDMATRKKSSRSRSRTPGGRPDQDPFYDRGLELPGSHAFERRSRAEMWEPEIVLDVMRRVHSQDRQRNRLFAEGDDYAEKSRMVREQLDLARRASRSINVSHEYLFDKLQEVKRKLSHHSMRMAGERRVLVSESHGALDEFHSRLEHVRQMRTNGRDTPNTVNAIENALKVAWEDFDDVRKVMLTNLKILNDAKEELMRERLHEEEESDEEQIRSLERMMYEIRHREYHKTEDALESIRDRRNIHGSGSGY